MGEFVVCHVWLLCPEIGLPLILCYTERSYFHVPGHNSCHRNLIAYKVSISWEFRVCFPP